jgi:hypothetical protein
MSGHLQRTILQENRNEYPAQGSNYYKEALEILKTVNNINT